MFSKPSAWEMFMRELGLSLWEYKRALVYTGSVSLTNLLLCEMFPSPSCCVCALRISLQVGCLNCLINFKKGCGSLEQDTRGDIKDRQNDTVYWEKNQSFVDLTDIWICSLYISHVITFAVTYRGSWSHYIFRESDYLTFSKFDTFLPTHYLIVN